MVNEIFDLKFDADAFVANIEKSIKALNELEATTLGTKASVERLGKGANNVNFMTPANSVLKLNSALQQTNVSTLKLDSSQLKLATAVKATDTANRAYAKSTETARKETEQFNKETQNTTKGLEGMLNKVKNFGGNILGALGITAGIAGLVSFGKAVIATTAEFEKYKAVLTNTLGSSALAQNAISTITEFASKTPFSVSQLTDAFVKLANQGFVPTIDEMRKLGDLASSTGKDFDQLAEAIIDAQTGEFERLKEFGIKGKVNGDKVTFAFKGVRTEIDNNAEAIRKYVLALGDVKGVTGSMDAISKTLTGQISNLGDSWDQMLVSVGNRTKGIFSGIADVIKNGIDDITRYNESMSALEKVDPNAGGFFSFFSEKDVRAGAAIKAMSKDFQKLSGELIAGAKSAKDYDKAIEEFKTNGRYLLKNDFVTKQDARVRKGINNAYTESLQAIKDARANFIAQQGLEQTKTLTDAQKKALDEGMKLNEAYQKALIQLKDRVARKRFETGNPDEARIKEEAERSYQLEAKEVEKTFGKLGKVKVDAMKAQVKALSDLTLAEDLKAFKERQKKATDEITAILKEESNQTTAGRIANIQDDYARENEQITFELQKQTDEIKKKQAERTKAINEQVTAKLITAEQGAVAIGELEKNSALQVENAEQASYKKRLDNAKKFFEKMLAEAKEASDAQSSELQKNITNQILKESERYAKGEINYAQYESRVEAIKRD